LDYVSVACFAILLVVLYFLIYVPENKKRAIRKEAHREQEAKEEAAFLSDGKAIVKITEFSIGHIEDYTQRNLKGEYTKYVRSVWRNGPGQNGDVAVRFALAVRCEKEIKYIRFWLLPCNRVDDAVDEEMVGRSTGPYKPIISGVPICFEDLWMNKAISHVRITGVEIEYMDGDIEKVVEDHIKITSGVTL